MNSTTSANATRTLKIDGMSGDGCVTKVTAALKSVPGVKTESVKVGEATIACEQTACDAACKSIDAAGFQAHEANRGKGDQTREENRASDDRKSMSGDHAASSASPRSATNEPAAATGRDGAPPATPRKY